MMYIPYIPKEYVKEKKPQKQLRILFWVFTCLFLAFELAVVLLQPRVAAQSMEDMETVTVRVVNVEEMTTRTIHTYWITVSYNGAEYLLKGDPDPSWENVGHVGTAYLFQGNIYADNMLPRLKTPIGRVYDICLASRFLSLILAVCFGIRLYKRYKDDQRDAHY